MQSPKFNKKVLTKRARRLIHSHLLTDEPSMLQLVGKLGLRAKNNVYPLIREYARELVQKHGEV